MKKNKLSVGLVASFIGALALTSCSSTPAVTPKDQTILGLVGYNGDTDKIEINTDDFYGKYSDSQEGTKLYYDAILEALVRYEYPTLSEDESLGLKKFKTLLADAEDKVTSSKKTAEENATTNGTTYDEEWDKILESHDCEDEEDLKQYYLYDLEKTELTDKYFKNNEETLMEEYIGVDSSWNEVGEVEEASSLYPYHILHVLVSLDASETDYVRGTISEANATKLWTVVRKLIDGNYTFEEIAKKESDDTGSKEEYGDVGMMTTKTSFYNEFKLGIYAYDAYLSKLNSETDEGEHSTSAIYKALGLDKEAKVVTQTTSTEITKTNVKSLIESEMETGVNTPVHAAGSSKDIPTVPYDVFRKIGEYADKEKIKGKSIEAGAAAYPRNVLFNQFLNFHSPFVITNEDLVETAVIQQEVSLTTHDFTDTSSDLVIPNHNFRGSITMEDSSTKDILTDSNGNVIIGVRSQAGIHFMVMRKSVFYNTNVAVGKEGRTLEDYYTTAIPGDEDFPVGGETYVNMQSTSDDDYYKTRANKIKDAVKSSDFDAAYDYRIYEGLLQIAGDKVVFFDADEGGNSLVKNNIAKYIELLRETNKSSGETSINEAWQTYLLNLQYQNLVRTTSGAMVKTTCAFNFNNPSLYEKDGACYVK